MLKVILSGLISAGGISNMKVYSFMKEQNKIGVLPETNEELNILESSGFKNITPTNPQARMRPYLEIEGDLMEFLKYVMDKDVKVVMGNSIYENPLTKKMFNAMYKLMNNTKA